VARAQRVHAATEQQIAGWPSTADVARALGLTRSAVLNRVHGGKLLAVRRDNGSYAFPPWQLSADEPLLHGLTDVLSQFPADYDAMAIHNTLKRPREEFGGLDAVAWWVRGGDAERVAKWVRHLS
jgi:prophage antirepressor-like protein